MKKRLKWVLLTAVMSVSMGTTAYADELSGADDWKVEFTSAKEMVSNFTTDAMNDTLQYLQPGDSATFKVELANTYESATDWYMTNKVIQSLEDASKTASGGAYSYQLTYTDAAGTLTTIYDSETVGGEGYQGEEGLHEATDALEDFFYLDTVETGETGVVALRVELDGETQGNSYQDTLAQLQLNFAVELPTASESYTTVYDEQERVNNTYIQYIEDTRTALADFVRTGDETVIIPLFISAAVLGILLLIVAIYGLKLRGKMKNAAGMLGAAVLAGALALTLAPTTSQAAESYTYRVRVLAGAQGTFSADGGTASTVEMNVAPGTTVNLSEIESLVSVSDTSKYYVKGVRESGKDNDELANQSYTVTQDTDLVIAYGMKATDVTYTVEYLNAETGEELYPTQTFYGNVGDKPVVAYQYVEYYVPQAYNLTKTLSSDPSQNVFTFEYTYNPNGGYVYYQTNGGIRYIDRDGETIIEYLPGTYTVTNNGVTVVDGGGNGGGGNAAGGDGDGTTAIADDDTATNDTPQEIIDLDDEDTPLASGLDVSGTSVTIENGARILTVIMAIASAVIIVVFGTFLILENRKKKQKK